MIRTAIRTPRPSLAPFALALFLALPAAAQDCPTEPPVLNHAFTGGTAAVCPCFVAGEQMGAVFDVPASHYPIEIQKLRFGWFSFFGGSGQSLEQAIRIYPNGLPNPGAPQFEVLGPVLTDGVINEFDVTGLPGTTVSSGPFSVALEFANSQSVLDAAPASDNAGCVPGRNLVFAIPGGWTDACTLGISGQWIVEIVYKQANRPLCSTPVTLSLSSGGSQVYTLIGGPSNAGKLFWFLGSASGTSPGFPVGPFTLPLNVDAYFLFTLNTPGVLISNQIGVLDGGGNAFASFDLPAGTDPGLSGVTLNHAYFAYDLGTNTTTLVSNAAPVVFGP